MTVWTVGHSTTSLVALVRLLRTHAIDTLVDIRRFPGSRRNPQFNASALARDLPPCGLTYAHEPALGGRRPARADSPNTGWRNPGLRGYADYMLTAPFAEGVDALLARVAGGRVAIMCAEAVPWRCHRALLADRLVIRGVDVRHILSAGPAQPHAVTAFARVEGGRVTYPGQPGLFPSVTPRVSPAGN